jgi:hypothetical protein
MSDAGGGGGGKERAVNDLFIFTFLLDVLEVASMFTQCTQFSTAQKRISEMSEDAPRVVFISFIDC